MLIEILVGAGILILLLGATSRKRDPDKFEPVSKEILGQLAGPLLLVVDDSTTIQKVVELAFAEDCLMPVGVSRTEDALEFLQLRDFAAALVDVHLPLEHGYDLCIEMKRRAPNLPVILLVGTFERFDQARFESSGADDVLKKPFDVKDLRSTVEKLVKVAG